MTAIETILTDALVEVGLPYLLSVDAITETPPKQERDLGLELRTALRKTGAGVTSASAPAREVPA